MRFRNALLCSTGEDFQADLKHALVAHMRPGGNSFHPDLTRETRLRFDKFLADTFKIFVALLSEPVEDRQLDNGELQVNGKLQVGGIKYIYERPLGAGAGGAVDLYRQDGGHRLIAIKKPPAIDDLGKLAEGEYVLPTDTQQARVATALREAQSHCKATDVPSEHEIDLLSVLRLPDGTPLIAMEYAPGGDAAALYRTIALPHSHRCRF